MDFQLMKMLWLLGIEYFVCENDIVINGDTKGFTIESIAVIYWFKAKEESILNAVFVKKKYIDTNATEPLIPMLLCWPFSMNIFQV